MEKQQQPGVKIVTTLPVPFSFCFSLFYSEPRPSLQKTTHKQLKYVQLTIPLSASLIVMKIHVHMKIRQPNIVALAALTTVPH